MFRRHLTWMLAIIILFASIIFINTGVYAKDQGWDCSNGTWSYYQEGIKLQEGWVQDYKGWCYIKNGTILKVGWVQDTSGFSCYIKDGYLMDQGWANDSKGWFYIKDGRVLNEGWVKDSEGWRYIKDGYMLQEGWAKAPEGWRYIKEGYLVQQGWAIDSKGLGYIYNGYLANTAMWVVDSKGWSHIGDNGYWDGQVTPAVPLSKTIVEPSNGVNGNIKISFIDVGLADSILIQQGKFTMLIDGGYDSDGPMIKNYIESLGINHLDYVIGTHPHEDHIGGLGEIINSFKVGKVLMPKATDYTKVFDNLMTVLQNKKITVTTPVVGSSFKLGDAVCTIVGPVNTDPNDLNTYSIVLKITYGKNSFLFTGDAVKSNELGMIKAGYDLSADVLKVGHHGVFTSTSQKFLDKVNPKYAVISVGAGHLKGPPAPEVLTRLNNNKINTFRTDINGTIVCTSNGNDINFDDNPVNLADYVQESDIKITNIDLEQNILVIKNSSEHNKDMSGWKLINEEENKTYVFPEGYILDAETEVNIAEEDGNLNLDSDGWNSKGSINLFNNIGELISSK
ncbi:MAG: MBL fold metallo-hydrolase [Solirubrobacterales bacterium]